MQQIVNQLCNLFMLRCIAGNIFMTAVCRHHRGVIIHVKKKQTQFWHDYEETYFMAGDLKG